MAFGALLSGQLKFETLGNAEADHRRLALERVSGELSIQGRHEVESLPDDLSGGDASRPREHGAPRSRLGDLGGTPRADVRMIRARRGCCHPYIPARRGGPLTGRRPLRRPEAGASHRPMRWSGDGDETGRNFDKIAQVRFIVTEPELSSYPYAHFCSRSEPCKRNAEHTPANVPIVAGSSI